MNTKNEPEHGWYTVDYRWADVDGPALNIDTGDQDDDQFGDLEEVRED